MLRANARLGGPTDSADATDADGAMDAAEAGVAAEADASGEGALAITFETALVPGLAAGGDGSVEGCRVQPTRAKIPTILQELRTRACVFLFVVIGGATPGEGGASY